MQTTAITLTKNRPKLSLLILPAYSVHPDSYKQVQWRYYPLTF